MINLIKSILKSPTTGTILSTGYNTIRTTNQPKLAPVAFGGSVVAGIVTMMISGYRAADCIRYQTAAGQCDSVIEKNLPGMITGAATIVGGWGAFNTFNPKLHEEKEEKPAPLPTKELVLKEEEVPTPKAPVPTPAPHPEVIENLHAEGNSQAKIAEMLGVSVYSVRKALKNKSKRKSANKK
jgi:hypothetical protein